jgi:hypothetical protein
VAIVNVTPFGGGRMSSLAHVLAIEKKKSEQNIKSFETFTKM